MTKAGLHKSTMENKIIGHNHSLITKVTLQSLMQQLQQAEVLLTFGDLKDEQLPAVVKESLANIRAQLGELEYRLGMI